MLKFRSKPMSSSVMINMISHKCSDEEVTVIIQGLHANLQQIIIIEIGIKISQIL